MDNKILSKEQNLALTGFKNNKLLIIYGGPGTGKTTVAKSLVYMDKTMLFCAPTGCAADRLSNSIGIQAHVIDKLEWLDDVVNKSQGCTLVIDETSMVNITQIVQLMLLLSPKKICLLGDCEQLQCITGMSILATLMAVDKIKKFNLTTNFRQNDSESLLVKTIRILGTGEYIYLNDEDETLKYEFYDTDFQAISAASEMYTKKHQMLALTNKTVNKLNEATKCDTDISERVVCTKNVYTPKSSEISIPNGMFGIHNFKNDSVRYSNGVSSKMKHYQIARCITVYKSQGSEYKEGILVITSWHGTPPIEMLKTAFSRFKEKVTVFAVKRTFREMLNGNLKPKIDTFVVSSLSRLLN
jgi:ATP-dependent exoDNAse (exonuclease V) alpha subunit